MGFSNDLALRRTEEDDPLLRCHVACTHFNPDVKAGMREHEAQAQQQAALEAE